MPKIIKAKVNNTIQSDVETKFKINYLDIRVSKPQMIENWMRKPLKPNECRIRDISYSGNIEVDIKIVYKEGFEDGFEKIIKNLKIG